MRVCAKAHELEIRLGTYLVAAGPFGADLKDSRLDVDGAQDDLSAKRSPLKDAERLPS
jgi:hypothetical protein